MTITPPSSEITFGFYDRYVFKVKENDLIAAMQENLQDLKSLVSGLTEEQLLYRYDTGKWNIKEMLAHLIDGERNFCYRIMRFSRGDQTMIPFFDVHQLTVNSHASERSIESIMNELEINRKSTIALFEGMTPDMLEKEGPARETMITVRALGYAIVGHAMHHMDIIKEKYLQEVSAAS